MDYYFLVRPSREFSMSWEYVDYMGSKNDSQLSGANDNHDGPVAVTTNNEMSYLHHHQKATKTTVEVPLVLSSILDEETLNMGRIHLVRNKESLKLSDVMEQTEKTLKYELLSNPPTSEGIGIYQFGTFTDAGKLQVCHDKVLKL